MKDVFLKRFLMQHGFADARVQITDEFVVISDFQREVSRTELKPEGEPIPGTRDNNYHNYVYPDGLVPGYDQIRVVFYEETHRYSGRVQNIIVPQALLMNDPTFAPETFVAMVNLTDDAAHAVGRDEAGNFVFTSDVAAGKAEKLLRQLLNQMTPRIAHLDHFKGPNYVSELGRIAPLIVLGAQTQALRHLLRQATSTDLLELRDELVDGLETVSELRINKAIFHSYLEKLAREEQLLGRTIVENLAMGKHNWIAVDTNFFDSFALGLLDDDSNANKLRASITSQTPLSISTTNGGHAFAAWVDFQKKTIFLANPLGVYDGFDAVVESIQRATGCDTVVYALTKQIRRQGDVDFDDVCTADAVMLAHMLEGQHRKGQLAEGSLNDTLLRTAHYLTAAHEAIDEEARRDQYSVTGWSKVQALVDEINRVARGNPGYEAVARHLTNYFEEKKKVLQSGDESLERVKDALLNCTNDARATLADEKTWGYLLSNLAVAVLSLGLIPLVTYAMTGQWRLFRPEQASTLDSLDRNIQELEDSFKPDSPK